MVAAAAVVLLAAGFVAATSGVPSALVAGLEAPWGDGVRSAASPAAERPAGSRSFVVLHRGETLWQVAQQVAPEVDPRDVVGLLRELNGLDGAVPQAGQRLVLPLPGEL